MHSNPVHALTLTVGGLSRAELTRLLAASGVSLNAYAETVLAHEIFDGSAPATINIVARSVSELGLADGGTFPEVFAAAEHSGLALCPPEAAPYLRLAWQEQTGSSNSVLSAGRAPEGALNVASQRLIDDPEFPAGFYLRVVDGVSWLRGYRCDDEYVFPPETVFAFRH